MASTAMNGAQLIARTLAALKVPVIFGIVGIPVVEVAEACLAHGIRFISFRNEQAASYAATAYGYMTGRPGVCLFVGGPGVLHALAGIGNATANVWPLMVLAGSNHTTQTKKGAFQELDAVSFLTPCTKLAVRPPNASSLPQAITNAYRTAFYGKPGPTFVDLPADLIQGEVPDILEIDNEVMQLSEVPTPPRVAGDPERIAAAANLLRNAKRPLIIVGKGACYGRSEDVVRKFVDTASIPFLPTPMGKGLIPDPNPLNVSAARSQALSTSDVIILLGARLNWMLHYGAPPRFSPTATIIQVDASPEEIGHNNSRNASLGIVGDVSLVVGALHCELGSSWKYAPGVSHFRDVIKKNEASAEAKARQKTMPMKYHETFAVIKRTLDELSPPEKGEIVYISEGANTMDISRSIFPLSHPRQKLDAGTWGTMGVGMGYAIAAQLAYEGQGKKVVAIEGDSAFGFSLAEIETMARYQMGITVFVINNSGIYKGGLDEDYSKEGGKGLSSLSLGKDLRYDMVAEGLGGKGFLVRTPEELVRATKEAFAMKTVPTVINVLIDRAPASKLEFNWNSSENQKKAGKAKL